MIDRLYVTGTDTGIGKTVVSAALLRALARRGLRAVGMKPVASGCEDGGEGWRNDDALVLQSAGGVAVDYALVNPYPLPEPTAPEIAAARAGVDLQLEPIAQAFARLHADADIIVVEGVGGWLAPLSREAMQSDLVRRLDLPVLLVVGIRLGCINHALLSARALLDDGVALLGWIGNRIDPAMAFADDTVRILRDRLPLPYLGELPFGAAGAAAAEALAGAAARLADR